MWQQSRLNGGGFIVGLLQDLQQPEIFYARSDVAGVFKSVDGGRSWTVKNHGMTDCHQHDIQSFAISPHDSNLLFRCSGSVRGGQFFGTIHKTVNAGEFWYPVCEGIGFYGNGETRFYGEIIQVDPHDPTFIAAGSYTNGLWISRDTGENWQSVGLKDERISCVCFHPTRAHTIYVGTIGSFDRDPVYVAQQYDYLRPNPARLYCSQDRGETWDVLHEGLDMGELVFDPADSDIVHVACINDGLRKSTDGGRTWVNHAPHLSKYPIGSLTFDPHDPRRLYAAAVTMPNADPDVPPIGLYRSTDSGASWKLVHWHTDADIHNYPSYMTLPYAGWAISKVRVDTRDSRTLYISNWYGVSISHDEGVTWDANHFEGMENICIENITAHPTQAGTVYMVMADHAPKVSTDGGHTYTAMTRPQVEIPLLDSTALVPSRFDPAVVLYSMKGMGRCSIVRTDAFGNHPRVVFEVAAPADTDEGRVAFQSRAAGVSVQALAEDPFQPGKFYAYLDGIIQQGAGLYQSLDWGETWERVAPIFPDTIQRVPYERHWIENELLSVVIAQTKNVCGTNQLLCVDPHRSGTLYVGEWTEGLFRSTDSGVTWQRIGEGLPFKRDRASVINVIRADERQPGVLYAGFIREGVWRSADYGDTWAKIYPSQDRIFNATSLAVGGTDGRLIVVVCEPLYYAPCLSAVMVSRDAGQTWTDIYDPHMGAIRWKTVALAAHTNLFYAGSCGNSAFYFNVDDVQTESGTP